eukprot:269675-Prorocentrum_minimum.AAC.1
MEMRAALNAAALSLVSERKTLSGVQKGALAFASSIWTRATSSLWSSSLYQAPSLTTSYLVLKSISSKNGSGRTR